jgi:hypothetical protein
MRRREIGKSTANPVAAPAVCSDNNDDDDDHEGKKRTVT